jgi:acyl transferase domain-containing protein
MDPQQRLVLEVAWEALESAALPADRLAGSQTGVFIGIESADYSLMLCTDRTRIDAYVGTGNAPCVASNRVSYLLDLRGPSMAIDTACSASLVAIHLACQSLRAAESDLALAGGVNLMLSPETTINLSKARMLAADGRCKTFDTRADGYVRGDGCGVVVLKRLSDALKDGDPVLALIRGSAVNQDGRSNGLTAPNGLAQQAVIRRALEVARLAPEDISYVEAHGTGTPLGDPIEIQALAAVLSSSRAETKPCAVGSVKTNIGHLETAAGVAGLIKVILALQHEQIPPHLHLRQLNPRISFDGTRLFVPTEPLPWPRGEALRSAGVSAFSFGGTNAHVIVQEAPVRAAARDAGLGPLPFCLSAKSQSALRDFARRYEEHLGRHPDAPLADVCYTAARGRSHFSHRLAIIADSTSQLREQLRAFVEGRKLDAAASGQLGTAARPKVAFLFTGQGSQYSGMGRRLYETRPVFREAVDRCADILRPHLDRPLASLLFASADSALDETAYTQPALFALEYALAQLWRSCGIEPDAVIGHSVGEYVAATIAGVFSLEDGLRLIAERARLMQSLPREGAMVAVFAGEAEVARALGADRDRASIAAVNAPQSTVISGEREAVAAVLGRLAPGVETRALNVSHAFHSPLMDPVVDAFESAARRVSFKPPSLTLVSNVSGRTVDPREAPDAAYWSRHLRQPVRFAAGVNTLWEHGCRIFVEIGPSPTLVHLGKRCVPDGMGAWLASLEPGQEDDRRIMMSAAQLYALGQEVNWSGAVPAFKDARRIALPTYPFQRSRYWFATAAAAQLPSPRPPTSRPASSHPLLGRKLDTAGTLSMMERAA